MPSDAPTPLTDAQAWPTGDTNAIVVHADFARRLERRCVALETSLQRVVDSYDGGFLTDGQISDENAISLARALLGDKHG